jgi:hypothetical protein
MAYPEATVRRSLEQAIHCLQEALSVVEHGEDVDHAQGDVLQARDLIERVILPVLVRPARPKRDGQGSLDLEDTD